jgi:hypothetical protein
VKLIIFYKLKSRFKTFKIFKITALVTCAQNRGTVPVVNCKRIALRVVVWSGMWYLIRAYIL